MFTLAGFTYMANKCKYIILFVSMLLCSGESGVGGKATHQAPVEEL